MQLNFNWFCWGVLDLFHGNILRDGRTWVKNIPTPENLGIKWYKLHNVSLGQYTISVGKSEFVHGDGLMGLRFSSSKNDEQPTIFRRPCDRWRHLLSYWCPCNHESKRSMQRKKGLIGKGDWCWFVYTFADFKWNLLYFTLLYFTDALDPDAHFDAIAKLCWGHRYRVVCVGRGRFTLYWRSCGELWKSVCNMLHGVIL